MARHVCIACPRAHDLSRHAPQGPAQGHPSRQGEPEKSAKGIEDTQAIVVLAVIQIFGQKFAGSTNAGRGQDHGIPKGELPTGLKAEAKAEDRQRVINHRPLAKIPEKGGRFSSRVALTAEVDVEFLKHLDTDGGASRKEPGVLDKGLGDGALFRGIQVVAVE